MSLSVHIMSFSCSRKEKMPLYLLRQFSVMTMLRGQSTCSGSPAQCWPHRTGLPVTPAHSALLTLYLSSRQLSTSGALGANTSGRYLRAKERLVACGVSPWRLYCRALLRMQLRTSGLSSSPGVCPAPS